MSTEQVKPGYKRTEVGVIPEEWKVVPIASLIERNSRITYGVVQPGKDDPRGVLFVRGGDVYDGTIDLKNLRRITPTVSKQYARTQLRGGELLISLVGFPGECAIAPSDLKGANLARQVALVRFSDNGDSDPEYICHLLRSNAGKRLLLKDAFGSAQQVINLKDVNKLEIPLPSRCDEQKAIATALSDVDALLAQLDQLIAKKRDLKQAAMQQLLTGQTRLSGFSGEWKDRLLPELANIRSGGTPSTGDPAAWNGDIAWCTPTDISALAGKKYLANTEKRITEHGLQDSSAEIIPAGSVIMTSRATIGECAINTVPMATNQGFKNFIPHPSIDAEFLYYTLTMQTAGFIGLCSGSTFLEIGKTQLRGYTIRVPLDKTEQTAIATILSDMDAELVALEARRDKTRALKQGMMQELLTGRIRLV